MPASPRSSDATMMRVTHVGRLGPLHGWSFDRHVHQDEHEMIVVVAGRIEVVLGERAVVGEPGAVLLYPRGVPHAERAGAGSALETIFIGWRGPALAGNLPPVIKDHHGRVLFTARWLHQLHPPAHASTHAVLSGLLNAMLHELAQCAIQEHIGDGVWRACQLMRRHYDQPHSLNSLAEVAALSPFHFARQFRRAIGQSPMQHLRLLRVEAARELLVTTNLPLRSIAPRVGFRDEFELSRTFKRLTGQSPSHARPRGS